MVTAEEIGGGQVLLTTRSTLATLIRTAQPPCSFPIDRRLSEAFAYFGKHPEAFALLVTDGPACYHVLSREWLAEQLSRPFFRELFLDKPVHQLLRSYGIQPLVLPGTTTIPAAIERALSRAPNHRYLPILVTDDQGRPWPLDVPTLLLQQCRVLSDTLGELERQRQATQAAEAEQRRLQERLLTASREAGRAEVATGVLHNVGNVLNSVNVSLSVIQKLIQQSKVANLSKAVAMLAEHQQDLPAFLSSDERGQRLPGYLAKLSGVLTEEQSSLARELTELGHFVEHMRQIVAMQQSYARASALREPVRPAELVEDALRVNLVSFERHNITIAREFEDVPAVPLDKHKILQALINLIRNAKEAVKAQNPPVKRITLRIARVHQDPCDRVRFEVVDNGIGIAPENLTRIFRHGFTTRKEGHGFGLHSAANAASEMGGSLWATSEGTGLGATFTLEVPLAAAGPAAATAPPGGNPGTEEPTAIAAEDAMPRKAVA